MAEINAQQRAEEFARKFPEAARIVHDLVAERQKHGLTALQKQALDLIRAHISEYGHSPTVREIQASLGSNSISTVVRILDALEERGHIRRLKGQARTIRLV